ncbi:TOBE domain-containing protein [Amycolatopsis sp. NPDC004625]|uniref:TOBE domain-containing protein n=1 Tax=Amycolatopsis sp. NPDC004625 TaxID=3154670 RepID=UPI0033B33E71
MSGISIRNQLPGRVTGVAAGEAMATVKLAVDGGELTAPITREAVTELGLAEGSSVVTLVKSTEISPAIG